MNSKTFVGFKMNKAKDPQHQPYFGFDKFTFFSRPPVVLELKNISICGNQQESEAAQRVRCNNQ